MIWFVCFLRRGLDIVLLWADRWFCIAMAFFPLKRPWIKIFMLFVLGIYLLRISAGFFDRIDVKRNSPLQEVVNLDKSRDECT